MLQQPVVRELRSFQSLSRFSGPRALVNRRQSSINARRYSHSRQRAADFSIDEQVFVNLFQFLYYSFYILSYRIFLILPLLSVESWSMLGLCFEHYNGFIRNLLKNW